MKNSETIKPTKRERRILAEEAKAALRPVSLTVHLAVQKIKRALQAPKACPSCSATISANKTACLACLTLASEALPTAA